MQLSCFNLYVEGYPTADDVLIHNTFADSYAVLSLHQLALLREAETTERTSEATDQLIADYELDDRNVGIVVASREAEEAEFAAWFRRQRSQNTLDVMVGINLACNFNCPYCCQAEVMDGSVMKPDILAHAAQWIAKRARRISADEISLVFVGGEPLLHPDRITSVVGALRQQTPDSVHIGVSLITNGYFLDAEMLDRLLPFGLEKAQITLDGDEDSHCRTRTSKRGEPTFERVFHNAINASHRIRVSINGNYQKDTVSGFAGLIRKLKTAGLPDGSKIGFQPALEALSASAGAGSGSCSWSGSDTREQTALHDLILANGFNTSPLNSVGPCEFHNNDHFTIDASGHIYKCPGFMGLKEWAIGDVESGLTGRYAEMLSLTPKQDPCGGCAHRPNCGGGCVAAEWIKSGDTSRVNCEADYFERVASDATIRGYLRRTLDDDVSASAHFPSPQHRDEAVKKRPVRPRALKVIAV